MISFTYHRNKCLMTPVDVVLPNMAPLKADLTYPEHKTINFFKVQWSNHTKEEATWESEEFSVRAI
jgi:hypothetical protein